jgi:3D (Asp-Asp-Asp) domain-containing protein
MYKGPGRSGFGPAPTAGKWMARVRRWRRGHLCGVVILTLALVAPGEGAVAGPGEASECESRSMRVTFYTCAEGFSHCLTKQGHQPIPFRTVAVGDRSLLGRWLYVEDLGGWVLAADTGVALKKNSIDVFMGEGRMVRYALRLGVQHWNVRVCAPVRAGQASLKPQVVLNAPAEPNAHAVPDVQPTTDQPAVTSTQAPPDSPEASDTRVASLDGPAPVRPAPSAAAPAR